MEKTINQGNTKNLKSIVLCLTGVLFLATAGIVYIPYYLENGIYELELTFLSNTIAGILFIYGGIIYKRERKDLPQESYMYIMLVLQLVFFICMAFIEEFNFSGGFIFLHIINPIIATIEFFLFTSYTKKVSFKSLLKALIFPYCYLFYAIVYGYLSDVWIYGILNIPERGIYFVVTLVMIAGIGILLLEYVQYKISVYISNYRLKNIEIKR